MLVATGTLSGLRTYLPINKSQVPLPPPPEALPQLAVSILPFGPKGQPWQHTPTVNLSPLLSQVPEVWIIGAAEATAIC